MQYSSLIRFIYAKTLIVDLNVLKNETVISVLCTAHFNIIALSDRWNCLKAHLCLDSKGWSSSGPGSSIHSMHVLLASVFILFCSKWCACRGTGANRPCLAGHWDAAGPRVQTWEWRSVPRLSQMQKRLVLERTDWKNRGKNDTANTSPHQRCGNSRKKCHHGWLRHF